MSRSKCSRELYCSFLEVTLDRYSAVALSEVVPPYAELSHDSISRWLVGERVQPKDLWEVAKKELFRSGVHQPGILVFDDVVIDKSRSGKTELVNWQYAGSKRDTTKALTTVPQLTYILTYETTSNPLASCTITSKPEWILLNRLWCMDWVA